MSKDGFIPVSLIASFNRMKQLTQDVKLIVDVCKTSEKLEVKDEVWVSILIIFHVLCTVVFSVWYADLFKMLPCFKTSQGVNLLFNKHFLLDAIQKKLSLVSVYC